MAALGSGLHPLFCSTLVMANRIWQFDDEDLLLSQACKIPPISNIPKVNL